MGKYKTPYEEKAFRTYFAIIEHLRISNECVVPDKINKGGTKDTPKGHELYTVIYEAINKDESK